MSWRCNDEEVDHPFHSVSALPSLTHPWVNDAVLWVNVYEFEFCIGDLILIRFFWRSVFVQVGNYRPMRRLIPTISWRLRSRSASFQNRIKKRKEKVIGPVPNRPVSNSQTQNPSTRPVPSPRLEERERSEKIRGDRDEDESEKEPREWRKRIGREIKKVKKKRRWREKEEKIEIDLEWEWEKERKERSELSLKTLNTHFLCF